MFRRSFIPSSDSLKVSNMGKARCEINWNWRPKKPLDDYDLWYAVSGEGVMKCSGATYPIRRGSCFLFRPGDQPQAEQKVENRLTVIYIHFQVEGTDAIEKHPPERHNIIEDTYRFEPLLEQLLEIGSNEEETPLQDELFDAAMRLIWLQLRRSKCLDHTTNSRHQALITRVKSILREQGGKRIPKEDIAAQVGLSADYLSILFKRYTGTSIKQFTTDVRLERAYHLLMETTMNVSQVAEALGYSNIHLFSKQFKEKYKKPPSQFQWKGTTSRPHK